jgi:uncharacterized protein YndB with AHSA1/START domain
VHSTRAVRLIRARRSAIYRALLDPAAVAPWRVPDDMRCKVHVFDAREGGAFRISLTYDAHGRQGKSSANTDTFHGRFIQLVPDTRVVKSIEFETDDPAWRGAMTLTTTLTDADGGTEVEIVHEGLPDAIRREDNELGT